MGGIILSRIERLDDGKIIHLNLSSGVRETRGEVALTYINAVIEVKEHMNKLNLKKVEKKVRHILRLDDDLKNFYNFARKNNFYGRK